MYFYSINENKVDLFVYPVVIKKKKNLVREPSWSWSHGSWIYNYIRNQSLLPL